ncbi:hypothetical protein D3C83_25540 [compost metagenome]
MRRGDVIVGIDGQSIGDQSEFYRRLWASGEAGSDIMLHVLRDRIVRRLVVHSADRMDYLRPWRA